jgi:hypothetical protein
MFAGPNEDVTIRDKQRGIPHFDAAAKCKHVTAFKISWRKLCPAAYNPAICLSCSKTTRCVSGEKWL